MGWKWKGSGFVVSTTMSRTDAYGERERERAKLQLLSIARYINFNKDLIGRDNNCTSLAGQPLWGGGGDAGP